MAKRHGKKDGLKGNNLKARYLLSIDNIQVGQVMPPELQALMQQGGGDQGGGAPPAMAA